MPNSNREWGENARVGVIDKREHERIVAKSADESLSKQWHGRPASKRRSEVVLFLRKGEVMADAEAMQQELLRTYEGEVIGRLLSGNDTCCFTTQQYADMAERVAEEWIGATRESLGVPMPPLSVRRRQLEALTDLREVQPDVWTLEPQPESPSHA